MRKNRTSTPVPNTTRIRSGATRGPQASELAGWLDAWQRRQQAEADARQGQPDANTAAWLRRITDPPSRTRRVVIRSRSTIQTTRCAGCGTETVTVETTTVIEETDRA
ncbi:MULTISPECIES: hypothetical protein [unclassified Crossiella]|uniref:hypothetical protein n=1 Tax=unclassified Crossiella TaxID=2620835 RepID=UPI001FFFE4ED|nr:MULTISPECIES: hypothetical protein [unclassified Crossiella]MCK2242338.1 hypothetical protein [Crossiella sp. S99.2]MCK2254631.1 hypothetical protein [Crossiella sp. S99.1]